MGNHSLRCWGDGEFGQTRVPGGDANEWHVVAAGGSHTCGLVGEDKQLICFGSDNAGQSSPPCYEIWQMVSSGGEHTCGILGDGSMVCW